jgi:hypothetical protein
MAGSLKSSARLACASRGELAQILADHREHVKGIQLRLVVVLVRVQRVARVMAIPLVAGRAVGQLRTETSDL